MSTLQNRSNKKSVAASQSQQNHGSRSSGPAKKSNNTSAQNSTTNAWNASANKAPNKPKQQNAVAQDKFKEIRNEHLKAAKKYTENYESSSDEEDFECQPILESVFRSYGGDRAQLQKTQEFLEHCFTSGASTCLICIGNVKRSDYVSLSHLAPRNRSVYALWTLNFHSISRFGHAIIVTVFSTWIAYKNGPKTVYRNRKSVKTMKQSAITIIKVNTFRSKWRQSNGVAQNVDPIICHPK